MVKKTDYSANGASVLSLNNCGAIPLAARNQTVPGHTASTLAVWTICDVFVTAVLSLDAGEGFVFERGVHVIPNVAGAIAGI